MRILTRKTRRTAKLGAACVLTLIALLLPLSQAQTTGLNHAAVKSDDRVDFSQPLTLHWRYESSQTLNLTPAVDDERIYLPLAGGTVISLMGASGQLNWRSEMGGELSASPVADQHGVYVATETGKSDADAHHATGALRSLGRDGGVTQWLQTMPMPLRGALTLGNGKLFGGTSDGKIYAFDSTTGEPRWTYAYGAAFNSRPFVAGSHVYIGSEDGNLLALDESTGKLLWSYKTKGAVRGAVANGNGIVYFGSGDGYVYALNSETGQLVWRKRTGAGVEAVTRANEGLLVASLDNFVYSFSLTGARLWKRRLPGRISSQPIVTQNAALFMPFSSAAAVVLDLRNGHQINLLPTGEEIATSASPVAVGEVILLTTEHGLLAFTQPKEASLPK